MKKEYLLKAGRNSKIFKQELCDYNIKCEVLLSEDLGLKKGDIVKVTIEKIKEKKK